MTKKHKASRIALRLEPDLEAAIMAVAIAERRNMSDMIRILARDSLQAKHGFHFDGNTLVSVPPLLKMTAMEEVENGQHS